MEEKKRLRIQHDFQYQYGAFCFHWSLFAPNITSYWQYFSMPKTAICESSSELLFLHLDDLSWNWTKKSWFGLIKSYRKDVLTASQNEKKNVCSPTRMVRMIYVIPWSLWLNGFSTKIATASVTITSSFLTINIWIHLANVPCIPTSPHQQQKLPSIAVTTCRKSKTQAESSDGIIYWAAGIPIGPNNTARVPAFVDAQFNTKKCLKKIVDKKNKKRSAL